MVNKQLIDYIENNLNAGYSKDSIRYVLIRNGYTERDVQGAFDYIERPPKSKRWVAPLIAIIVILIVVVNIWYFKPFSSTEFIETQETGTTSSESSQQTASSAPSAQSPLVLEPISVSLKTGQSSTIAVSFMNSFDSHNFRLEVLGTDTSPETVGMTYDKNSYLMGTQQAIEWTLKISPPEGSNGVYVFSAKVSCEDCDTVTDYTKDFIVVVE